MIIDASIGVKWLIPEEDSAQANALVGNRIWVPSLFFSEVSNAIWKKARQGEIEIAPLLPELSKLKLITQMLDDAAYFERALVLGNELDHPVYDCLYLAAAESLGDILVTADKRFLRKVASSPYVGLVRDLASGNIAE